MSEYPSIQNFTFSFQSPPFGSPIKGLRKRLVFYFILFYSPPDWSEMDLSIFIVLFFTLFSGGMVQNTKCMFYKLQIMKCFPSLCFLSVYSLKCNECVGTASSCVTKETTCAANLTNCVSATVLSVTGEMMCDMCYCMWRDYRGLCCILFIIFFSNIHFNTIVLFLLVTFLHVIRKFFNKSWWFLHLMTNFRQF